MLAEDLNVLNHLQFPLARENKIPIAVFNLNTEGMMSQVVKGHGTFTLVN